MTFAKLCIIPALVVIMGLSFYGCATNKMPEKEPVSTKISEEGEKQSANNATDSLKDVENDKIEAFVSEYNKNQTDESLQVADEYNIYYDEQKGVYYVKSDKASLTIRLDEDGEVISAALTNTDDITKQLAVSNVLLDMFWGREYVPEEQQEKMDEIREQAERMQDIIAEKTEEFEKSKTELNTNLPEATLPVS